MDDLYGDLENYNVDNTISELQIQNKELKCKLDEYASNLDSLQKDFDNLSKEYKKLEQNYSSLLKTAKAEIERKTHIIANLNLEKDKMVLKCFQNKKGSKHYGGSNSPMPPQTRKLDVEIKPVMDDKLKHNEGNRNLPLYHTTTRKDLDNFLSKDTMASSNTDLRSKLLTLSNSATNDSRTEKSCYAKENITKHINDAEVVKARSSIINRRKSMPALSSEIEQFSSDDDDDDNNKMVSAANLIHPQIYPDHGISERPRSRMSETSSLEERRIGYEAKSDSNNPRYSRYDREQNDRFKVRHKSSHRHKNLSPTRHKRHSPDRHKRQSPDRHKRQSPDRYQSGSREFQDNRYFRSELDRHRPKERVIVSPPRDVYHQRISREPHRNIYERNQYREQERLPYRSHKETYSSKRRIDHVCNDSDTKKARLEQQSAHHEDDRKMQLDRQFVDKNYAPDTFKTQFSSCESPDYDNPDVTNQQVKEIKLTASTKLDDPRISSKKYILQNNVDQVVLSTAIGRNIDIVPLSKIAWGIKPVSMPEALLKMPLPKSKQSIKHMCMEIENPTNVSLESGEISDLEDPQKVEIKVPGGDKKNLDVSIKNIEESKDSEKVVLKINSYKIPKLKKTADNKHNLKNTKVTSLSKKLSNNSSTLKNNDKLDLIEKIDVNKHLLKLARGKKIDEEKVLKQKESIVIQSNSQLPFIGSPPIEPTTDRAIVEDDLEMSDDNCDAHVIKDLVADKDLDIQTIDNSTDIDLEKKPINPLDKVTPPCQVRTPISDVKKSKSKKKTKHKEDTKSDDTNEVFSQPSNKNDRVNDHRTIHIKTKFSELFDDSSSLISPEDLGMAAVPASTTRLPDKSVPFFEDAMDAADLNPIKLVTSIDSIPPKKLNDKEKKPHSDIAMDICNTITVEPEKQTGHKPAMTDNDIANIYKNLEPGDTEHEESVVQTVVISTGVQPPVLLEVENQMPKNPASQIKTVGQDVLLKALATSTPHKLWQPDVNTAARDPVLPDASSDSNNDSQKANVENTVLMNKSDTNTIDSQSAEIPDVRIFVKRRKRKVVK